MTFFDKTETHKEKGSGLVPWPQRLSAAPPRLEEIGVRREEFQEDSVCFSNYNRLLHDTVSFLLVFCFLSL